MLGSANQLKTNPIVFEKLKRGFVDSMKQGNLSDELAGKINHNLALTFGEGADIRNPKIWREADTFEKRAALADVMMGQGTAPSKGGVAIGGEKSGKGVIFRPTDILKRETEPSLLHTEHGGNVPTFAAGPRLFRLNKESVYDPTLHPGFPTLITGEDLKLNMIPTPTEVYLRDWHSKFKKDNPERKGPGYYDLALGVKGEGLPSQELNDEYIRHLLREGFKKGGKVDIDAADRRLAQAIEKRMAKGGKVDIAAADARLQAAIDARTGMAKGGEVGFKKIQFMNKGGKLVEGGTKVMKKLFADPVLPAAERDANLQKFLEPSKTPMRLYHGTTSTEGGKGQEAIRRLKPSKEGALGSGVYMTPNTAHASSYTGIPNDDALAMMSQGNDYTKKMADQFMADRAAGKLREGQAGGNMLPVHAQIRNPLIIGKSGRNIDPAADALMSLGMDEASAIRLVEKAFEDKGNIGKQIQTRAQAQGYDGIMQYRGDDLSEVVSYRPNAVKSAIGNRGTYDINEPDLSKAHGGLAMAKGGKLAALGNIGKRLLADPTAPRSVSEGDVVNGMLVRKDIPNTSSIGASLSNYSTHGLQEVPMSAFQTVGKPKYYSAQEERRTKELARQIQENKELNPLIVVKDAEGHYILEGGHRFDALRELGIDSFPALMVHDLESLGKKLPVPPVAKAEGGGAFKTIQWQKPQRFDGGGIASPEEVNPFEGSRREPLLTEKDWANIKRNAPEVYEWAKQNMKDEASQLKSARGVKDFALRTGAQYLGGIPDLVNLGLMGVDALANTSLSSEKPWFGSEQYIDALKRSGAVGEHEFPIAETVAGVLAPAGLIKKGVKKMGSLRPAKESPKKRRGGLAAMSR